MLCEGDLPLTEPKLDKYTNGVCSTLKYKQKDMRPL
jgi:hypothetical protein